MNSKFLYRFFLITGCILWVSSWIGDTNGILPAATIGMIISVISTGIGIVFWFKSYKEKRGFYPNLFKIYRLLMNDMKQNPFNGIYLMFKHLFKFYALVMVFSMFLVFIGFIITEASKPVNTVQYYCENNTEINKITGNINHYGVLRNVSTSWNSESGTSDLSLIFASDKGVFNVSSTLVKENGTWLIQKIELRDKNSGEKSVYKE